MDEEEGDGCPASGARRYVVVDSERKKSAVQSRRRGASRGQGNAVQ